ncbi:efflux RND transporter periplasmic adaptor subunit [Sphingobacterium sp. DR205]|uniref:efflux RND transporter periplasmic adaptor subunit n=1 Tax=Sphingobacterium sp. DR205 TaxID=2713573 RepID=UPI0013E511D6|nr:efflux RND transporter periplasmic adaptor subunit [Sphingobacterium sp. DR205]QIH34743.1 efflux RND transporter periplasmic adaptor subunit [Sphingobacterium sp. DR205]
MEFKTIKRHFLRSIPIGIASLLFLVACNSKKAPSHGETDGAISVDVARVEENTTADDIALSGSIEGMTTVKAGFMVPGKINGISIKVGQFVSKGQLIATLDATNYALNKQLADVQVNEAKDEYQRLKYLHDRGSLSASDFSKMTASFQRSQLQQKLEAKNLSDTRLYAPISGVLLSKEAEVGEIISAGTPLFVVSDIKQVTVIAFVPENELNGLHLGQAAKVAIAAINKSFDGKITEVGSLADATSRSFMIKITVNNDQLLIRPGMIAQAIIGGKDQKKSIQLPLECIMNDLGNQRYVYVVDKTSQKAFKRPVSLGEIIANKIEILSGLSLGETVVISGQTKLSDGSPIKFSK